MDRVVQCVKRLRRACARPAGSAPLFGLLCALSLYYAFVATSGKFQTVGFASSYYDELTEGFRAGHLYVREAPKPELLARANPYDYHSPDDWDAWKWDASFYNGHFYMYWGPTPALCLWLVKALLHTSVIVHDQWIVLLFTLLRLYAGTGLIVSYARSQYPELPRWALYLAIGVFAVGSPTMYFLVRPNIYEACIACGQGFLCLGLYCAYKALLEPRAQTRWLIAAGSCLGLALGARASLILSAPLIVLATILAIGHSSGYSLRRLMAAVLAMGTPAAAALALYAFYNYARFDSFTEFGLSYQLTGRRFFTHDRYFLPNLFSYTGAELSWSCKFPFVQLPSERHLSKLFEWPYDYDTGGYENGERVGGVLVATSVCWLWSIQLARAFIWLRHKSKGAKPKLAFSTRELWLMLCSVATIVSIAPASRLFLASMRYLEDAATGVLLGAIGAGFWLLRRSRARDTARQRLAPALFAGLAIHSIFVGVALGFSGYNDSFRKENKALFGQLERTLSVCDLTRRLEQWRSLALQTSESGAFYVAWRDVIQWPEPSRQTQRRTARP